uniref:Ig-like domain-containing protein n=1 Tax=Xenopus tropicalis TaxID=8364 RepID=A0A6I8Q3Z3_XENTR
MRNMKNLLWFIAVLSLMQCVTCQIFLTQPSAVTVKPLEVLQLPCKVTGASLTDSSKVYAVDWVRDPAGKGLEFLGRIWHDASTRYAQSLQGRLTVSRDTDKGEVYIKLTGMKPEETAVYYCTSDPQWDKCNTASAKTPHPTVQGRSSI